MKYYHTYLHYITMNECTSVAVVTRSIWGNVLFAVGVVVVGVVADGATCAAICAAIDVGLASCGASLMVLSSFAKNAFKEKEGVARMPRV